MICNEEITIEDGLLFKGTRIIVPTSQTQDLFKHIHLSKCLHQVKQTVHWPRLYDQIYELVTNCKT